MGINNRVNTITSKIDYDISIFLFWEFKFIVLNFQRKFG